MKEISVQQLADWLQQGHRPPPLLVDVREQGEFAICQIADSLNMPMRTIPARYLELAKDAEIVMICHHGARSFHAGMFLEQQGFANVINLQGGIATWAREIDPAMPTY